MADIKPHLIGQLNRTHRHAKAHQSLIEHIGTRAINDSVDGLENIG